MTQRGTRPWTGAVDHEDVVLFVGKRTLTLRAPGVVTLMQLDASTGGSHSLPRTCHEDNPSLQRG
jgi:hypothetical protein